LAYRDAAIAPLVVAGGAAALNTGAGAVVVEAFGALPHGYTAIAPFVIAGGAATGDAVAFAMRTLKISTKSQLAEALLESEDSESLNTSFVERMNLTLRQSLAYLRRRSPAHARCDRRLDEDLDLVQCHYNCVRPHLALKFGNVCKTPAMQAGLAKRPLSFRDIFGRCASPRPLAAVVLFPVRRVVAQSAAAEAPLAA
jgi:hypothetical protein